MANEGSGEEIGAIDIPYLFRDKPPDYEAPSNPASLIADEWVATEPQTVCRSEGLAAPEGPYAQ